MGVQYISNEKGKVTAVQLPIKEWERIKQQYPDIENLSSPLPDWQQQLLNDRLESIQKDPQKLKPINGLFEELNK